jgi:hypothetical protein
MAMRCKETNFCSQEMRLKSRENYHKKQILKILIVTIKTKEIEHGLSLKKKKGLEKFTSFHPVVFRSML